MDVDERNGLFGPGSVVWKVDRETAVLLASGQRALLMQVAHPMVAAAVADHSRYASDPMGRLRGTLDAIYAFAFADREGALQAVGAVNRRHAPVRGALPVAAGSHAAGAPYRAMEPALLAWVYATLVDSSLLAYQTFVAPLTPAEQDQYYGEMRRHASLWGMPPTQMPESLAALRAWMDGLMANGDVAVSDHGRTIARRVLAPPTWWIPAPLFLPVSHVATWLLPPTLRRQYGLPWGPRREAFMRRGAALSRQIVPRIPQSLRDLPIARAALARTGTPPTPAGSRRPLDGRGREEWASRAPRD
jgi:uncharacterized protein (DUF2236 family)